MKHIKLFEDFLNESKEEILSRSVNEAYEVHYSDGVRAMKKFNDKNKAMSFAKDLIKTKKSLQFVDIFNAGSGFNSTADTDAIVAFWGDGSYTDNVAKKDSKLAAKKIDESAATKAVNEAVKVDIDLAQITVDVLADQNARFSEVLYINNMTRDIIRDRYGKLPRGFAGPTTMMAAGQILSPLAGDSIYMDDVDLVKGDKTVMKVKPNTTWADVKKALEI